MTHRAYKYRLYPTEAQQNWLEQSFAAVRVVYNAALHQRNEAWRLYKLHPRLRKPQINAARQSKEINFKAIPAKIQDGEEIPARPGLADDSDLAWITETPKDCLDAALRDLDKAFDRFFKQKGGYPSFRRYDRNNSLSFKAWMRKKVNGQSVARPLVVFGQNCVTLPKIGRVKYKRHRKFYGDPKTVEVTREGREYYVILVTEHQFKEVEHSGPAIGVDLGVALPVMLSTGAHVAKDEGLQKLDARIRKEQHRFSKKKKGSIRRERQKRHLAKLARKRARRRAGNAHRITTELTRRFSMIAIEDLKISNMTKSSKGDMENPGKQVKQKAGLNREILNVTPYQIRAQLEYKAEKSGAKLVVVDPKHTSQTCHQCGHISAESRKSQAVFICSKCGHRAHADHNAALNILMRANPSAGALARRKSPSEFRQKSATTKANVSCFQPASDLKSPLQSGALP